jgi:microcystin-dependent protein
MTEISFTQVPMGTIIAFGLNEAYIPQGWLLCDGRAVPPEYNILITALGPNLPDLRMRTLIGTGAATNQVQSDNTLPNFPASVNLQLGNTGGEYNHQLTIGEMPSHIHDINGRNFGVHHRSFKGNDDPDHPLKTNPDVDKRLGGTDPTGGGEAHNTMQPYYAVNYIIYAGESNI